MPGFQRNQLYLALQDLRYVMDHYDGTQNIGKLVAEAV